MNGAAKTARPAWPLRADGTQKTMGEMTREEQDAQLRPICEDLKIELAQTLPRLIDAVRCPLVERATIDGRTRQRRCQLDAGHDDRHRFGMWVLS